jgi:hypothetical protein
MPLPPWLDHWIDHDNEAHRDLCNWCGEFLVPNCAYRPFCDPLGEEEDPEELGP